MFTRLLRCDCPWLLSADLSELDLPRSATIRFPHGKDKIMEFELSLQPDEGLYR